MTPSTDTLEHVAHSSGLWTRSVVINILALVGSRFLLSGFELHGASAYLLAAVGLELPTFAWWFALRLWEAKAVNESFLDSGLPARLLGVSVLLALTILIPLVLATFVPGLLVAVWISPLKISHASTYAGAAAITAGLTIGLGGSRPLRFVRGFLQGDPDHPYPIDPARASAGSEEASRAAASSGHWPWP